MLDSEGKIQMVLDSKIPVNEVPVPLPNNHLIVVVVLALSIRMSLFFQLRKQFEGIKQLRRKNSKDTVLDVFMRVHDAFIVCIDLVKLY